MAVHDTTQNTIEVQIKQTLVKKLVSRPKLNAWSSV